MRKDHIQGGVNDEMLKEARISVGEGTVRIKSISKYLRRCERHLF